MKEEFALPAKPTDGLTDGTDYKITDFLSINADIKYVSACAYVYFNVNIYSFRKKWLELNRFIAVS